MKVFISWSGNRSKAIAEALNNWLPNVIQAVEPWVSQDIEKGARWSSEIADSLEQSKVGIFCLTPDNLESPWLHFEAGAVSKTKDALAYTFLVDIEPANVKQPLGAFQHTKFEKDDFFKLLESINRKVAACTEKALDDARLRVIFDKNWPDLEKVLRNCKAPAPAATTPYERPERELLEEVLDVVRNIQRDLNPASSLTFLQRGSSNVALNVDAALAERLRALDPNRVGLESLLSSASQDEINESFSTALDRLASDPRTAKRIKFALLNQAARGMPSPAKDDDKKKD